MDPAVIGLTFAAIFLVELPDKTFIATLVLSTKFRPLLVWIGVGLAFTVQTTVAVALGKAASLLPDGRRPRRVRRAVPDRRGDPVPRGAQRRRGGGRTPRRSTPTAPERPQVRGSRRSLASFLVLFAAEWGDLSQLLTLSLVAKYDDPVSVFIGALGALLAVSGLACVLGRVLLNYIKLRTLHYLGGSVCLVLLALTVYELLA